MLHTSEMMSTRLEIRLGVGAFLIIYSK